MDLIVPLVLISHNENGLDSLNAIIDILLTKKYNVLSEVIKKIKTHLTDVTINNLIKNAQ